MQPGKVIILTSGATKKQNKASRTELLKAKKLKIELGRAKK